MRTRPIISLVLIGALGTAPALAGPSRKEVIEAKQAGAEGKKHEKKHEWQEARADYQRALDLHDTPVNRIRLARAEEALGHLLEAAEHLRAALESKRILWHHKRNAKKDLKSLEERIPTLTIEAPAGFQGEIEVDGETLAADKLADAMPLNPGNYQVVATAEGYQRFEESVDVAEGDTKVLTILLTELPPEKPAAPPPAPPEEGSGSARQTWGWISLGVGGAGLVFGTVMGLSARSTRQELSQSCPNDVCSSADRDLYDEGQQKANLATAGFVVAGVGIGLGSVLLLTGGDADEQPARAEVTPVVGLGQLGVRGRF